MNIYIPHRWLLKHLDTQAKPEKLRELLSLSGPSVERIETREGEPIYDIEVTTNRVDMMSVRGIAREAATILPEFDVQATLKPLKLTPATKSSQPIDLTIKNDPKLCHRILALTMSVDKVGDSPKWLQKRLLQVGQRPLNSLIDITNYVMWELGHPIHVFDYDKLKEKTIIVRQAKAGEKFTTLDNKTHTTSGGEVVFDDGTGTIVDLPGIMGTKNSVVSGKTKNILVWIESVPATYIRQASMGLAIRTQAAVLNEKHVDPNLGKDAILYASQLYQKIAGARATSELTDIYPKPPQIKSASLSHTKLTTYLGTDIKPQRVTRILENLGCTVKQTKTNQGNTYQITPPSARAHDLKIDVDYIEEVARIYGYHNLGSEVMDTPIPDPGTNFNHHLEHTIKSSLVDWGLTEVYTYSLVSKQLAQNSGINLQDHLELQNPLTDDLVYLRRSLIPSHNLFLSENTHHKGIEIFEIANVYIPQKGKLPVEQLQLVATSHDLDKLKGLLTNLAQKLRINELHIDPKLNQQLSSGFEPNASGSIYAGKLHLGTIGQTSQDTYSLLLLVDQLEKASKPHPTYIPIPKTSPVIEDITIKLPPQTHLGPVINTIQDHAKVASVSLKDRYQQNFTFSLSYHDPKKQLTLDDAAKLRSKLLSKLKKQFNATLIGKINN